MAFAPVLMTLGYVLSVDRERVLMVQRTDGRDGAPHGTYNGLGGKMEPSEDVAACMAREIFEESGITVDAMSLRGTVSWPGSGNHGDGRFGFVFLVTDWSGQPFNENAEGPLTWIPLVDVLESHVTMWQGRERWISMVFDGDARVFHAIEPFAGGDLVTEDCQVRRW